MRTEIAFAVILATLAVATASTMPIPANSENRNNNGNNNNNINTNNNNNNNQNRGILRNLKDDPKLLKVEIFSIVTKMGGTDFQTQVYVNTDQGEIKCSEHNSPSVRVTTFVQLATLALQEGLEAYSNLDEECNILIQKSQSFKHVKLSM